MAIQGYFDVFPEKCATELRTAVFQDGGADDPLPDGTFIFTEYFCTHPACDCQCVLVKVLYAQSEDARPDEVATISYTWNPNADEIWGSVNAEMPNPFLDPLHRQTLYAAALLDFWSAMVEHDKGYASRIQRHYREIRAATRQTEEQSNRSHRRDQQAPRGQIRPLTKLDRKARKQRLARARKGK